MSQSFSNNTNSLNTTVNVSNTAVTNILTLADDRRDLLYWLSTLDPKLKHQAIQARRVENVGEWFLQTEEFRSWGGGSGGCGSDIVKMMQKTSSRKRTFICIDALDECVAGDRVKILDSLNKILERSPDTRIFITGRPHVRPEIRRCLAGRVTNVSISPKRDDIIRYIHSRLHEDTTLDAMDSRLEADILKKIPQENSEMYVESTTLRKLPQVIH